MSPFWPVFQTSFKLPSRNKWKKKRNNKLLPNTGTIALLYRRTITQQCDLLYMQHNHRSERPVKRRDLWGQGIPGAVLLIV